MASAVSLTSEGNTPAEQEVRALYRRLLAAWNERSAAGFAAGFAEDGNVVGFDGSQMDGREAIVAELSRIFLDHATGAYVGKVRDVRLLSPDSALLRAVAGLVPAGASDLNPDVNSVQTLVAVRRGARWQIALFQNTPAQFHGRPELAQQLTDELRQELSRRM